MFDRKKQPQWLKLANLIAVLCIILLVFVPLRDQPVWATFLLLAIFVAVAAVNFAIQFRDVLFRTASEVPEESKNADVTEASVAGEDQLEEKGSNPPAKQS